MSASRIKRRWLRAVIAAATTAVVTTAATALPAPADSPEPLQRLGRFVGAGWGDGYHACESSGFRPVSNLPPRSFYQQFGNTNGCQGGTCAGEKGCATAIAAFYSHSGDCDGNSCDQNGCDALGCDVMPMHSTSPASVQASPAVIQPWSMPQPPVDATPIEWETAQSPAADVGGSIIEPALEPAAESAADRSKRIGAPAPRGKVEELPAPKPSKTGQPKSPGTLNRPGRAPESPSDALGEPRAIQSGSAPAASSSDTSGMTPKAAFLLADLHEAEMRPIRPLPPQPKRELTRPQTPSFGVPATMSLPSGWAPESAATGTGNATQNIGAPEIGLSGPAGRQAVKVNHPGVKTNPFVQTPTSVQVPESAALTQGNAVDRNRPYRVATESGAAPRPSAPEHRVAEVPEWLIIKQPR
tara:strand:- start:68724 stop:69962 length:1239 start_codon:yes stop_codon:yes gene_type:complete